MHALPRRGLFLLLSASLSALLYGCPSGARSDIEAASDTGSVVRDSGRVTSDAAPPSSDGQNPLDPDAGIKTYTKVGSLHVGLTPSRGTTPASGFISGFFLDQAYDRSAGCSRADLGNGCSKVTCIGGSSTTMPPKRSAGTLQYAVRNISQSVSKDANNHYNLDFGNTTVPFAAGDDVAFQALGETVPGFDTSVHMESQARIDAPQIGNDNAWTVGRVATTTVHFLGGSGLFSLQLIFGASGISVECTVPASSEGFAIPAGTFTGLAVGTEGFVTYASTNGRTEEIVDEWKVVVESHTAARMSDGRAIPFKVIVQ